MIGVSLLIKPPWIVNEAGQELGNRLDEDSPDYSKSVASKAKKAADEAGHSWYSPEITVTKQFLNYMEGVSGIEIPVDLQQQPYTNPYDGDKGLPITNWLKDTTKPSDDEEEKEIAKSIKKLLKL